MFLFFERSRRGRFLCLSRIELQMNTLEYYKQYPQLCERITQIQGQLQFYNGTNRVLLARELKQCKELQQEIKECLDRYIPYPLPTREYCKALEEQEFLFYRFIKGLTMCKTAELMHISRDTVYRIQRRIAQREGPIYPLFEFEDS